ncbi:MAG TPA: polysaccharide deacetylase family protein [Propionibacteriaceae bacterium]|nr:polysaccharide deacetylase family protein [Propionibacteriaceae bacterium]
MSSILATLKARNVRATFFATGEFARAYPGAVRAMARAGYPVGNHSDTHPHFPDLTNTQIALELSRAEASITPLTGKAAKPLFRFPFGDREQLDITVVNRLGYIPFRWTVDSLGWQGTESTAAGSAAAVCKRVVDAAVPGGIALMHVGANPDDGTTFDADALPCIISGISAKGYRFVDIPSQLG